MAPGTHSLTSEEYDGIVKLVNIRGYLIVPRGYRETIGARYAYVHGRDGRFVQWPFTIIAETDVNDFECQRQLLAELWGIPAPTERPMAQFFYKVHFD